MAAISAVVARQTTGQTNTSASTWSDCLSIADGDLVDGATYLLMVMCFTSISGSNASMPQLRMRHGTTDFDDSDSDGTPTHAIGSTKIRFPAVGLYNAHFWFKKWVAVSGEGVTLQHLSTSNSRTQTTDQIHMLAARLSGEGLVENTDWWSAEVDRMASPLDLTTSAQDGASVTFTPAAGDKFLVLTSNRIKVATTGIDSISRISESQGGTTSPQKRFRNQNTSAVWHLTNVFPVTLASATSTTIKEQALLSASGAAGDSSTYSKIFVLRLSAFLDILSVYTDGLASLGTTAYGTTAETGSFTITSTGNAVVIGSYNYEPNALARFSQARMQVNPDGGGLVDTPATITSDNYQDEEGNGSNDERGLFYFDLKSFTSGAGRTINLDGSGEAAGAEAGKRAIAVFSLELAGGGVTPTYSGRGVGRGIARGVMR